MKTLKLRSVGILALTALCLSASAADNDGYIESLPAGEGLHYGGASVNTRFVPTTDCKFEIDFAYVDIGSTGKKTDGSNDYQQRLFGAGATGALYLESYISGGGYSGFAIGAAHYHGLGVAVDTNRHRIVADLKNKIAYMLTGTTTNGSYTIPASYLADEFTKSVPIALFASHNDPSGLTVSGGRYAAIARVYGVKAYRGGMLVHDYKPCVKGDVPGFYDQVDGAFVTGENVDMLRAGGDVMRLDDDAYVKLAGNKGTGNKQTEPAGEKKYISLDYQLKTNSRVELDCALYENYTKVNNNYFFYFASYCKPSDVAYRFYFIGPGSGTYKNYAYQIGTSAQTVVTDQVDLSAGKGRDVRRTFILDSPGKQAVIVTAGYTNIVKSTGSATLTTDFTTTLRIGANFDPSGFAPLKIYGCKVYEDGVLVRDYRPCAENGLVGLKDTVQSGAKLIPDVKMDGKPQGFLPMGGAVSNATDTASQGAYLTFDGTQSIDTGYKPNGQTRIEVDVQMVGSNVQQRVFQAEGTLVAHLYQNGSGSFAFKYSTGTTWPGSLGYWNVNMERLTIMLDALHRQARIVTKGGTTTNNKDTVWNKMTGVDTQCTDNLFIGGIGTQSGGNPRAKMRLYGFKIYEGGVLKRDFIPYKSDTQIGLYDTVTEQVYTDCRTAWSSNPFTVSGANATLSVVPHDTRVDIAESATLNAFAPAAKSYRWYKNGVLMPEQTGPALTIEWRRGTPHDETYAVRPVYDVLGGVVVGDASQAVVTHSARGLIVVIQ